MILSAIARYWRTRQVYAYQHGFAGAREACRGEPDAVVVKHLIHSSTALMPDAFDKGWTAFCREELRRRKWSDVQIDAILGG